MPFSSVKPASAVDSDSRLSPPESAHSRSARPRSPLRQVKRLFHGNSKSTAAAEKNNGTKGRRAGYLKNPRFAAFFRAFILTRSRNPAAFANISKAQDDFTEPQHPQTIHDARPATENAGDQLTAAYREALYSFNKQAVEAIQQADGMLDLIQSLDKKRVELHKNSWFHRGLDLLHDPLRKLDLLLPLGKAFASLDPTTATAFGIVAAVIGVRVHCPMLSRTLFRVKFGATLTKP